MSLKKTVILSALFHLCFFAAILLGRYGSIPSSSSKISDENVFFVKLTVGIDSRDLGTSVRLDPENRPSESRYELTPMSRADRWVISTYRDSQKKAVSVKTETKIENNSDFDTHDLNPQEEPANNVLLTDHEPGGNEIIDVSFGADMAVNVSYDLFSSGDRETPGGKDRDTLPTGIFELIRNSIERAKTYPILARKRGIEGTVYINFGINSQGFPQNLEILKSSGSSILDTATLDILKKAAPFPYVDVNIEVPVVFKLN